MYQLGFPPLSVCSSWKGGELSKSSLFLAGLSSLPSVLSLSSLSDNSGATMLNLVKNAGSQSNPQIRQALLVIVYHGFMTLFKFAYRFVGTPTESLSVHHFICSTWG